MDTVVVGGEEGLECPAIACARGVEHVGVIGRYGCGIVADPERLNGAPPAGVRRT
jgi:hypothetical protein